MIVKTPPINAARSSGDRPVVSEPPGDELGRDKMLHFLLSVGQFSALLTSTGPVHAKILKSTCPELAGHIEPYPAVHAEFSVLSLCAAIKTRGLRQYCRPET